MTPKNIIKPYHKIVYSFATKSKKHTLISLGVVLSALLLVPIVVLSHAPQIHATPTTWYVSKFGNDSSGNSWTNAWNELNQINWTSVHPGDSIEIDGGSSGMAYTTTLSIGGSGTAGNLITIEQSSASGHNGTVSFFGGNTNALPYCGQTTWGGTTAGALGDAIDMNGNSYITINGNQWDGIDITGFVFKTINFSGGETNVSMSNLAVHDNGSAFQSAGTWFPEFSGFGFYGTSPVSNLTFNRINVYDNGEDNFQGDVSFNGVTVQNSWMHYTRTVPSVPSEAYNLCVHNDGLQLFGSNNGSGLTFDGDVFGPGLTNGFIAQPEEDNVTINNSLVLDPGSNVTVENAAANNWTITHNTFIGQDDNLTLEGGTGHQVNHNIFYAGNMPLNSATITASSNCEWRVTEGGGTLGATVANPNFVTDLSSYPTPTSDVPNNYPAISFLQSGDFSLQSGSPCTGFGSTLTSVNQFLAGIGGQPTTGPTVTINQASGQSDPSSSSPVNFTAIFERSVSGFDCSDILLAGTATGKSCSSVTQIAPNDGTTYQVAVAATGYGTISASIPANAATDTFSLGNLASTSSDNTVSYQPGSGPTVTINADPGQASPTAVSPVTYQAVFSRAISGFSCAGVNLAGTATGKSCSSVTQIAPNDGTTYQITVAATGYGTVIATIPANSVMDSFSLGNAASTTSGNTITYAAAGVTSSAVSSVQLNEGGTYSYTVSLGTVPTATVTYTITPSSGISVGSGSGVAKALTFTAGNWNTPQTVILTAVNNNSSQSVSVYQSISSSDPQYAALQPGTITVAVTVTPNSNTTTTTNSSGATTTTVKAPNGTTIAISGVSVAVHDTGVVISWKTNPAAKVAVYYGTKAQSYDHNTTLTTSYSTTQSVTLTQLTPCLMYYYYTRNIEQNGTSLNGVVSSFTTSGCTGQSTSDGSTMLATNATATGRSQASLTIHEMLLSPIDRFINRFNVFNWMSGLWRRQPKLTKTMQNHRYQSVMLQVLTTHGSPVKAALITLHSSPQVATTDKNGLAVLKNVLAGGHKLTVKQGSIIGTQSVFFSEDATTLHVTVRVMQTHVSWLWLAVPIFVLLAFAGAGCWYWRKKHPKLASFSSPSEPIQYTSTGSSNVQQEDISPRSQ